jgi:hypothetical protein
MSGTDFSLSIRFVNEVSTTCVSGWAVQSTH